MSGLLGFRVVVVVGGGRQRSGRVLLMDAFVLCSVAFGQNRIFGLVIDCWDVDVVDAGNI